MAEKVQQKRKNRVSKPQITSDDEEKLQISDEDLEFLDEGVVKKVKKQTSRLRRVNEQTPCWKFFQIPQGDERVATCTKCSAVITCVDKRGKLTTTALNTHLRVKHGNQLDDDSDDSDIEVMNTNVERSLTWMTVTSRKMIQSSSA